jgi:hypothetical protein
LGDLYDPQGRAMSASNSDNLPPGEVGSFAFALEHYRSDYHQLINARGASEFGDLDHWINQPITEASIASCLAYFYGTAPIALLLYFFAAGELSVWLLNTGGVQFRKRFPLREEQLADLGQDLNAALRLTDLQRGRVPVKRSAAWEGEAPGSATADLDQTVLALSRILFPEGLAERLTQLRVEHLIIIPTLNIQQVPFSILRPFAGDDLFIDRWSYSVAASIYDIARLTLQKRARHSGAVGFDLQALEGEETLFVGNPHYSSQGDWILPPLPGAEAEVKAICQQFAIPPDRVLIGAAATLSAIKEKAGTALLLYLATHGVADPEDPLDGSGLFFTPEAGNPEGFWSARAIQEAQLPAALVVLSACQTGLGQRHDAGVIGLSRAFHLAGAENVIMSLWSVDDVATQTLMQLFMEELRTTQPFFPSEPLRQAMLKYRRRHPDQSPLFWASFSTLGTPY